MGTRATIRVKDSLEDESDYAIIYSQYDGDVQGIGYDIKNRFGNHKIVNGFNLEQTDENFANGMGCFAAQLVKHLKHRIGNTYLSNFKDIQQYNYIIYCKDEVLYVNIDEYDGPLSELV